MTQKSFFRSVIYRFGFEIGLAILLGTLWLHWAAPRVLSSRPAPETLEVLASVDQISSILREAETNQQAFMAYKQPGYLTQYNQQVSKINQEIDLLQKNERISQAQKKLTLDLAKKVTLTMEQWNFRLRAVQGLEKNTQRKLAEAKPQIDFEEFKEKISASQEKSLLAQLQNQFVQLGLLILSVGLMFFSRLWLKKEFQAQGHSNKNFQQRSTALDSIISSMNEAVVVTDENGYFMHWNAAAHKIIGSKIKEVNSDESIQAIGFHDVHTQLPLKKNDLPFQRALRGSEVTDKEIYVINKTHPEGIIVSASSRSLHGVDGSIWGSVVVFHDITKRHQAEQDWIAAREAAIDASRQKSEFLAEMSHEIRTPMNGVLGMTTLLNETDLTSEQKDYVGVIGRSANSLVMLINDILDHSKIEAGKISLDPQVFDLNFVAQDAIEIFQAQVNEKNIGLVLEWNEQSHAGHKLSSFVLGDAGRIRQILVNLIGNAVKFTERGNVSLAISSPREDEVLFEITDSGPGMSEGETRQLFQKYFQTHTGRKSGGTGLGLSICKKLVDLMSGEIGVRSLNGQGTCFWFSLPLKSCQAPERAPITELGFTKLQFSGRILVAEDQLVNQRVILTYLKKFGLEADLAINGREAVTKAKTTKYDLILMDCQMPHVNGFEATKILLEQSTLLCPIVALTAQGSEEQKKQCLEAGMKDVLVKPLELASLIDVLKHWLPESFAAPASKNQLIDFKALKKLRTYQSEDKSLIEALIEDYETSTPQLLANIKTALTQKDEQLIRDSAHALYSASATLGAHVVAGLCKQLEDATTPLVAAAQIMRDLEQNYVESLNELKTTARQQVA